MVANAWKWLGAERPSASFLYRQAVADSSTGRRTCILPSHSVMTSHVDEETPLLRSEQDKKSPTPLPWFQFSIVLFLQLAEPLTSQVIYPFTPEVFLFSSVQTNLTVSVRAVNSQHRRNKWKRESSRILCWFIGKFLSGLVLS
jgi:hypothetical protein